MLGHVCLRWIRRGYGLDVASVLILRSTGCLAPARGCGPAALATRTWRELQRRYPADRGRWRAALAHYEPLIHRFASVMDARSFPRSLARAEALSPRSPT